MPYTILGILVLAIAVVFSRVNLPEIKHDIDDGSGSHEGEWRIFQLFRYHPMFILGLFSLLAYEVAEISINSYFINFVTAQGWMGDKTASVVLTVALAFFMIGRFVGSWIMRHVSAEKVLTACAAGSVISMVLVLADCGSLSMYALIANYLFEAIMFPTIFSLSLRGLADLTKSASSLLMMTPIGGCGFLLMGMIADASNMVLPFIIPLVGYTIVLVFAIGVLRKRG